MSLAVCMEVSKIKLLYVQLNPYTCSCQGLLVPGANVIIMLIVLHDVNFPNLINMYADHDVDS